MGTESQQQILRKMGKEGGEATTTDRDPRGQSSGTPRRAGAIAANEGQGVPEWSAGVEAARVERRPGSRNRKDC